MISDPPRIEAIDRALQVIMALADAGPDGAALAQLAEKTEVNKSTAYRALSTLRHRGFAVQLPGTGNYALGPEALSLASRLDSPANLKTSLHPALVALSREVDELVHLGVLIEDDVLYLDKVEPVHPIRVWSTVNQRVPVATSSLGRAFLAARGVPDDRLGAYLAGQAPQHAVSLERLTEAVHDARRLGYAVEFGENMPGVGCVGLAICRSGQPVAALSITALLERMPPARQAEFAAITRSVVTPLLPTGLSLVPPRP